MTLQLRVGGVYRNRNGEKVEIEHFDRCDTNYPYTDSKGDCYTDAGNYYISKESPRDLIAEWDHLHVESAGLVITPELLPQKNLLTGVVSPPPNPVGPQPDPRVVALEEAINVTEWENHKLWSRINDLGAQLETARARIAELEPLVPQPKGVSLPKVESVWWLMGRYRADLFKSLEEALGDYSCEGDILVRHDTITAPDGSVTYKCEVE